MIRLFYILLVVVFASCNGTYYITSSDHRAHHPNCKTCTHYSHHSTQWSTSYTVVKPYRPNYYHRPHGKPRRKRQ